MCSHAELVSDVRALSLFSCYNLLLIIFIIGLGSPVILLFGVVSLSFTNKDPSY